MGAYGTMEGKGRGRTAPVFKAGQRRVFGKKQLHKSLWESSRCPLTQRIRGLQSCRERTLSGWGRTLGVSRTAHPSPIMFSAVDTPPAQNSLGTRSVSGQFLFPLRPSAVPDFPHFNWRDGAGPARIHTSPPSSLSSLFLSPGDTREGPPGIGIRMKRGLDQTVSQGLRSS